MTYKGKKNRVLQNENLYALDEIIKEKRQRLEKKCANHTSVKDCI